MPASEAGSVHAAGVEAPSVCAEFPEGTGCAAPVSEAGSVRAADAEAPSLCEEFPEGTGCAAPVSEAGSSHAAGAETLSVCAEFPEGTGCAAPASEAGSVHAAGAETLSVCAEFPEGTGCAAPVSEAGSVHAADAEAPSVCEEFPEGATCAAPASEAGSSHAAGAETLSVCAEFPEGTGCAAPVSEAGSSHAAGAVSGTSGSASAPFASPCVCACAPGASSWRSTGDCAASAESGAPHSAQTAFRTRPQSISTEPFTLPVNTRRHSPFAAIGDRRQLVCLQFAPLDIAGIERGDQAVLAAAVAAHFSQRRGIVLVPAPADQRRPQSRRARRAGGEAERADQSPPFQAGVPGVISLNRAQHDQRPSVIVAQHTLHLLFGGYAPSNAGMQRTSVGVATIFSQEWM